MASESEVNFNEGNVSESNVKEIDASCGWEI